MAQSLNFLNKNFSQFNESLQQYIKDRFPNDYTDISQANPGQMFIDLASYVGTVNSFYLDNQLQSVLPQYSTDIRSLLAYAYVQGYPIRPTTTSNIEVVVRQLIPAKYNAGSQSFYADMAYAMYIPANTEISSNNGVTFLTESPIDFSVNTFDDPTEISTYSYNSDNEPEMYVATKKVHAIAGKLKTKEFTFTSPIKFNTIQLSDSNIIFIQSAVDSSGNKWYEVPYLGQNTIFKSTNNVNYHQTNDPIKYVIGVEKITKRFVARFRTTDLIDIEFGAGIYDTGDLQLVPTLDSIKNSGNMYNNTYDPINPNSFLYTKEYGEAPSNTTITFTYVVGGGSQSNVSANSITSIDTTNISFNGIVDNTLADTIKQNLAVSNPNPAVGGRNNLTLKEIRNVLISNFASQDRAINTNDYAVRCLALPSKYGYIAKSFVQLETKNNNVVNISTLSKDTNGNYTALTPTLKNNLYTYISEYKSLSDILVISDAYIINIAVEFEITVHQNHSPKNVINSAINKLKSYFASENWQINQPIVISDIIYTLSIVEGVQSVSNVNIINKSGGAYSSVAYDISLATKNNVIYPSIDPSIFEIKFPDVDIYGRVKNI